MGLFSFLSKNKQASTAEDSGYYSGADEQALNARARSKRASSASEAGESAAPRRAGKSGANDPVLPEKKRARRRLVGAIGLALAVAIGLPMILDSEPKPLASDIEIRIPSKAQGVSVPTPAPALGAALDESEQVITPPQPILPSIVMPATDTPVQPAPVPLPAPKVEVPVQAQETRPEARPEPKPEPKPVARIEPKPPQEVKPESKPEVKATVKAVDSTRALAILEGRPAVKPELNYVVQVAALATQDKVDELQARLKAAGIASYTQKISTAAGQRIRVRVGPFGSREEADKALARLAKLGLNGSLVPA
jgi:DedD protein